MNTSFVAKQEIEFMVPMYPVSIKTTHGAMIPIEQLCEENIAGIFDSMKLNAIEYMKAKRAENADSKKSAAGRKLANNIGG